MSRGAPQHAHISHMHAVCRVTWRRDVRWGRVRRPMRDPTGPCLFRECLSVYGRTAVQLYYVVRLGFLQL